MKLITKIFAKLRAISFYPLQFKNYGTRTLILRPLALDGKKNIELGTHVIVQEQSWLAAVPLTGQTANLIIGDDCVIGHFNHIYATQSIVLENHVLIKYILRTTCTNTAILIPPSFYNLSNRLIPYVLAKVVG